VTPQAQKTGTSPSCSGQTPSALAQDTASHPATNADVAATAAVVRFHIPTITCADDLMRVEASVRRAVGVLNVAFEGRDAIITYDPTQVAEGEIAAAIEAGGDLVDRVSA
jgi:hypothetical protein